MLQLNAGGCALTCANSIMIEARPLPPNLFDFRLVALANLHRMARDEAQGISCEAMLR